MIPVLLYMRMSLPFQEGSLLPDCLHAWFNPKTLQHVLSRMTTLALEEIFSLLEDLPWIQAWATMSVTR